MQISDLQFDNFIKICEKNNEFLFGDKAEIRSQLENVLASQGYWSGLSLRYYLDGDGWTNEARQFGK